MVKRKLAPAELDRLIAQMDATASREHASNPHLAGSWKLGDARVDAYRTGTVVVQGEAEAQVASLLFGGGPETGRKKGPRAKAGAARDCALPVVGCDEVGTGDYFGGITVCAALVLPEDDEKLRALGVADSKTLGDAKIEKIAPAVAGLVAKECLTARPETYNALYARFGNANAVKAVLHDEALRRLLQKLPDATAAAARIVMDQFTPRDAYYAHLARAGVKEPAKIAVFETKAEGKWRAVAAASVLARAAWLADVRRLSGLAGFPLQRGASSPLVLSQAKQIFARGGRRLLRSFVKLHFSYTDRVAGDPPGA